MKLGEVVEYLPKSKRKAGDGLDKAVFPFFSSSQIQNKWLNECDYKEKAIILGTGGQASIHHSENFSTSADVFIVKTREEKIKLRYVYYFLQSNIFLLENGFQGVALQHLSKEYLSNLKIPLPPKNVQEQIVAECEVIDQASEQAQGAIDKAKKEIGEVVTKEQKENKKLNEVVAKISETINPNSENGEVNYIGLENIESSTGQLVGDINFEYFEIKSNKMVFQKGDILYGKLRPNLNKVHKANFDGICSTDILVFRVNATILSNYYKHYFLSKVFSERVLKTISGQQLPRTSWNKIKKFKIPVPLLSDQEQLASKIEKLETTIAQYQAIIDVSVARKNEILKSHL